MDKLVKKHAEKIRYLFVGGFNTALDFCLLFIFVHFGVNKIVANYFSTGVSMRVSFYANKHFTFKNTDKNKRRQFIQFMLVTMSGMWIIQPLIIWLAIHGLSLYTGSESIQLFIAKIIATGASLVWNYVMYSRLVFKKEHTHTEED